MSVQAMTYVLDCSKAELAARLVLLAIANHADKLGRNSYASVKALAIEANLSERQTRYALRKLENVGEIRPTGYFGNRADRMIVVYEMPLMNGGQNPPPVPPVDNSGGSEPTGGNILPSGGQFSSERGAICDTSYIPIPEENRPGTVLRTADGASSAVDKSKGSEPTGGNLRPSGDNSGERRTADGEKRMAQTNPQPPSVPHRCKPGGKLCAALRAPADQLFSSSPQRFQKLIKWTWLQLSSGHEEVDIIAALVSLQGREESYGQLDDWWAYLEGANGTGQSMIERVRSRRLQGEAAEYKKPGPVKLGDLADLARLAVARK